MLSAWEGTDHRRSWGDTTSAGGVDMLVSWRNLTDVSERFLCMSVPSGDGGRCLILRCPEGFCRTRAGTLSLLHRWSRGREPFTSAWEKRAAVELHLLAPTSPLKGSFQTRWVNPKRCISNLGARGTATAAGPTTHSPELFLIAHFTLMSCHQTQTSSLHPSCHMPGGCRRYGCF